MDKAQQLREGVWQAYSTVAEQPEAEHPFAVGRAFAERLGYPTETLNSLPHASVEAFTGVSNVAIFADILEGATVLDLGCGAGLDSLIAAQRVGPYGKVIGVDFSEAMLTRARQSAVEAGISNVEFRCGDAEALPLETRSIDVALVNGIFNLNPAREAIFRELARVVRPGGAVYAAEMILREPLPEAEQNDLDNWFA
jgi:arsenite methyltransferase